MKKLYLLITGIFLVTFLIIGSYAFLLAAEEEKTSREFDPFSPKLPIPKEEIPSVKPEEISDPTLLERIDIQGLIWGTPFPQAIINGKIYKVGDTIEGTNIKIVEIKKGKIEVECFGKVYTVKMKNKLSKE